jgi:hypothetical protein
VTTPGHTTPAPEPVDLRHALADAIAYRTPGGYCHDCTSEHEPCGDHQHDAARRRAYQALLAACPAPGRDTDREAGQ